MRVTQRTSHPSPTRCTPNQSRTEHSPHLASGESVAAAVAHKLAPLAFLSWVDDENPGRKTVVKSARRALNTLRSFMGLPPLAKCVREQLLTKASHVRVVATVRQSPGIPTVMIAAIIQGWGRSPVWRKRQTVAMMLTGFLILGRGAGVTSCLAEGISWVSCKGHQIAPSANFNPAIMCDRTGCSHPRCVKGYLTLVPFRKNKQHEPTWIPVAEKNAIELMAAQLRFLRGVNSASPALFLDRARVTFVDRKPVYLPLTHRDSGMKTDTFRALIRMALRECCGLTQAQAEQYGTHSLKIGAIELLRSRGVGQELRQQLGGWMSSTVALRYLQLTPSIQFDILKSM